MEQPTQCGAGRVEEMQGLYGPYAFAEKLLQKIWLLGLFERRAARLADGRQLEVLAPGRWNLLGGPDFLGARLRIAGREVIGDVEVHFHAADWQRHGHDADVAYDQVALHVVLFEPKPGAPPPRTLAGREIAQFVLLPWLHCSLEEFAADDAVESLAQRDACQFAEALLALNPTERGEQLRRAAAKRWQQKVHFASVRIARLGWDAACHHTALEILGYRFNRAAMLAVAERFPLDAWSRGVDEAAALAAGEGLWRHQGVRPANAPRRRLAQYRAWMAAAPDWPRRWLQLAEEMPVGITESALTDIARVRRDHSLARWREGVAAQVTGGVVGGARLATLVGNGLLPLVAARTGREAFGLWFCGEAGEVSELIAKTLRLAGVVGRGAAPRHEGAIQGVLQMVLERPIGWGNSGSASRENA
ncbi:MAG: DUF2851 family protein [Opitutaceae bacterium]